MLEESGGSSRSKDLGRSPDHRVAGPGHQHGTHGISTSCSKRLLVGVVASTAWSLGFFTLLTTWDKSQRRWKRRGCPWYHSKKPQSKVLTLCTRLEGIVQTHLPCSAQSAQESSQHWEGTGWQAQGEYLEQLRVVASDDQKVG